MDHGTSGGGAQYLRQARAPRGVRKWNRRDAFSAARSNSPFPRTRPCPATREASSSGTWIRRITHTTWTVSAYRFPAKSAPRRSSAPPAAAAPRPRGGGDRGGGAGGAGGPSAGRARRPRRSAPGPDDDSADDLSFPFLIPSADAAHLRGRCGPRVPVFHSRGGVGPSRGRVRRGGPTAPPGRDCPARALASSPRPRDRVTPPSSTPRTATRSPSSRSSTNRFAISPWSTSRACAVRWRCDPSPSEPGTGTETRTRGRGRRAFQNEILGVGHTTKTHVRRREGRRAQPDHIGVHRALGRCPGTRGDSRHRRQRRRARVIGVLRRRRLRRRSVSSNGRHAGRDERQNVAAAAAQPVNATSERRARAHPTRTKRYRRYFTFYTAFRETSVAATPGDDRSRSTTTAATSLCLPPLTRLCGAFHLPGG